MAHDTDGEGVDQGVSLVDGVEDGLPADVGQAQGVAVVADSGHDSVQHAGGVGVVDGTEAQLIHHGHGAGAHRDDVAHDSAHTGGGTLVGFDVAGVVVGLDLEGHGPAVADVDDAGVLTDAHEQVLLHVLGDLVTELRQVDLGRLVGAVLGPHDRVHRQLRRGGATSQDLADLRVFVGLQPEVGVGLIHVGIGSSELDGLLHLFGSGLIGFDLLGFDLRGIRRVEVTRHVLLMALSYDTASEPILAVVRGRRGSRSHR